jgi:putative restriction endonuclease
VKAFVAVTDRDWYDYLQGRPDVDEVNFWQPGGKRLFDLLGVGEPLLFKLHWPDNFIVGGGFFAHASLLDARLAWEAFGEKNGAATFHEMCDRIEHYRRGESDPRREYIIGCIILRDPFFFPRAAWIPAPSDFKKETVQGKTYDLRTGTGRVLWQDVTARLGTQAVVAEGSPLLSIAALAKRRLGQGTFRILITDSYERRCAVTKEKALPVLEAAHIRPVSEGGEHRVDNGLLLRSDIHALFDRGYVTVTPEFRFRASTHLKTDFDNGEHYRRFEGEEISLPRPELRPSRQFLEWHGDTIFRR